MNARGLLFCLAIGLNLGYSGFLHCRVASLESRIGAQPQRPDDQAQSSRPRLPVASAVLTVDEPDTEDFATDSEVESAIEDAIENLKSEMQAGTCLELEVRLDELESNLQMQIGAAVDDHEAMYSHSD